jgi:primosomal protein N' (replication factor Y) (superfamily II helicase)
MANTPRRNSAVRAGGSICRAGRYSRGMAADMLFDNRPDTARGLYAEVALPTPVDRLFDYAVPEPLVSRARVGHRVTVPFGRRSLQGYIVGLKPETALSAGKIKPILEAPDDDPLVTKGMLELTRWMADYYACSWGEALQAVLPAVVRTGRKRRMLTVVRAGKPPPELLAQALEFEQKADAARAAKGAGPNAGERNRSYARILRAVGTFVDDTFTPSELAEKIGVTEAPVRTLAKQGWLRFEKVEPELVAGGVRGFDETDGAKEPTPDQRRALEAITASLDKDEFKTFLLFGVTGSGKTEVYIRALEHAVGLGKSAIVLVPEISLTPQTVRRFSARFDNVSVLHSGMTDAQRRDAWRAIASGKSRVVIGPRSALFAPVVDLGLIVVDEEHEATYKQDHTPRYHARDTALVRARLEHAGVILGSATPSLESWHNAKKGKYELLELTSRVRVGDRESGIGNRESGIGDRESVIGDRESVIGNRESASLGAPSAIQNPKSEIQNPEGLATVEVIDMAQECREQKRFTFFSRRLQDACGAALKRGEQVIIFLNRRGYHTVLNCGNCGQTMMCRQCDIPMSFHRKLQKMTCHYCLDTAELPRQCPYCGGGPVKLQGMGTERLEEELNVLFAGYRIARMDSDVMKTRDDYEETLDAFRAGETRILVGTQMIAKGLDFPNVTVVGVISADVGMGLGDFRSYERSFQLLTQVAGRAGRGSKAGTVIVQTFQPQHVSIETGAKQDYRAFAEYELEHRAESKYPPLSRLVLVTVEARQADKADDEARKVANTAQDFARQHPNALYAVAGPFDAPIAKLRDKHRRQVMLKARGFADVRNLLQALKPLVKVTDRLKVTIDVDPVSML